MGTSHRRCHGELHLEGTHHRPLDCHHWGHRFDLRLLWHHSKTSLCKNRFHMFTWLFRILTHSFTYLLGRLRITTRRQVRVRHCRCPLKPDGRIRRQRCDTVVLVSFVYWIVLSYQACFTFYCRELYWMYCCCVLYILHILEAPCPGRQPKQVE
jgi:hypothetical protein